MGLETIVGAIADEADAEVSEIRSEADVQVARIRADAAERAAEERDRWSRSRDEEADRVVAGIVNRARLHADRKVADAREELFQEALGRLREEVIDVVEKGDYARVFRGLYDEALKVIPDPDATVLVRPADAHRASEVVRGRGATGEILSVLDCLGGLDIEAVDGRSVRNTLDARLAQSERRLRRLAVELVPQLSSSGGGT